MKPEGKVIIAKPIVLLKDKKRQALKIMTKFCYYFPAYKLEEARRMPHKHIHHMLREVTMIQATEHLTQLRIATAPHIKTKSGHLREIRKLEKEFREIINGGS